MTVQELITALLGMPMDAEVVKSYPVKGEDGEEWVVEGEDGEEWIIEESPCVYQASDKKVWL